MAPKTRQGLTLPLALLLLAGCAPVRPDGDGAAELAQLLAGRTAAETQACVPIAPARSLRVIDSSTLVYDQGGTLWVNRLRAECPGLQPHGTLIVEPTSGQYCRGDKFRELETGAIIAGPTCILGDFTAYRLPQ
jgi:hypothetical protein